MPRLVLSAAAFVAAEAIAFAGVSLTPVAELAYPVVVTMWTVFVWLFCGRAVRAASVAPHSPRRAAVVILIAGVTSIVALVAGISFGVLLLAR